MPVPSSVFAQFMIAGLLPLPITSRVPLIFSHSEMTSGSSPSVPSHSYPRGYVMMLILSVRSGLAGGLVFERLRADAPRRFSHGFFVSQRDRDRHAADHRGAHVEQVMGGDRKSTRLNSSH